MSISPNAKLLDEFQNSSQPQPAILEFPLKSSFRAQSSFNFSPELTSTRTQFNTPASLLKHNTQLNSRSPSQPQPSSSSTKIKLRSSLPPRPPDSTPSTPIPPTSSSHNKIPHRIIRTPRSFLIKRRGSLTPLIGSFTTLEFTHDSNSDQAKTIHLNTCTQLEEQVHKRKVRFDQDVFCLEFDQLPEELPLSRQKRLKTNVSSSCDPSASLQPDDSFSHSQQRSLQRRCKRSSSSIINSSTRPRRHSPRLTAMCTSITTHDTPPFMNVNDEDNQEQEMDSSGLQKENDSTISLSVGTSNSLLTTVDISSLSLNPPSHPLIAQPFSPPHFPTPQSPLQPPVLPNSSTSSPLF